ncbi:hypothetical protein [uncultured Bartonella sp.]|uniref:hypothetical protein n=1 Tax=uncultured Bartonella sp. TaxID=104108 RepID=UPI0025D6C393|nr:hypothetical protein [uncultured Bartonella sp.]
MRLIRRLFRFISYLFLVLTIVTLVIDAAHSVGASEVLFLPIGSTISFVFSTGTREFDNFISHLSSPYLSLVVKIVGLCPAWIVFASFTFIFYVIGYDREAHFDDANYGEENV